MIFEWWMVAVSAVFTFIGMACILRHADKKLLCNMRNDGLTEQDIEDIVGTDGYRRLNRH